MNIRGLILEDREHTLHLQALQFVTPNDSGSELQEDQPDRHADGSAPEV